LIMFSKSRANSQRLRLSSRFPVFADAWALHWAGPVLNARPVLRRTLSGQVGNRRPHLLSRGHTAAARV
jgi:hypothetical protein